MPEAEIKQKLQKMVEESGIDITPEYSVDVMGKKIDVPVVYRDASAFMVFFRKRTLIYT